MKACLTWCNGQIYMETNKGIIRAVSASEARSFLESFDSDFHYSNPPYCEPQGSVSVNPSGELIAYVTDENCLVFVSGDFFRDIFAVGTVYITPAEYAKKHGKEQSIVQRFCRDGRFPGAVKKGVRWMIPENAPYPEDPRKKNTRKYRSP